MAQQAADVSCTEKAPLKYTGSVPWEILLSEAQKRMTIAVSRRRF